MLTRVRCEVASARQRDHHKGYVFFVFVTWPRDELSAKEDPTSVDLPEGFLAHSLPRVVSIPAKTVTPAVPTVDSSRTHRTGWPNHKLDFHIPRPAREGARATLRPNVVRFNEQSWESRTWYEKKFFEMAVTCVEKIGLCSGPSRFRNVAPKHDGP